MRSENRIERLFVYGSLLRGQAHAGMVADQPVQPATLRGNLWRLPAGYPALVPDPSGSPIHGELLDLEAPRLNFLDHFEGVGKGLYRRERCQVHTNGQLVEAWVYVMDRALVVRHGGRRLKGTDWRTLGR